MSQVNNVLIEDEVEFEEDSQSRETTLTPEVSGSMNAEARRRIEQMREEAALRRALNDDIFDY